MKKRIAALLLALFFALGLAAGCTSEEARQALELAQSLEEALQEQSGPVTQAEAQPASLQNEPRKAEKPVDTEAPVQYGESYDTKEEVALYLHLYGELPPNYMTKKEAQELGWEGGSLERFAPGKCIGGSTFGNYEGRLPKENGRTYKECDIGTLGKSSRGAKRIVYSNDGLIYYTDDHYETFTLLYGEE
jgi:ribonuclease T1